MSEPTKGERIIWTSGVIMMAAIGACLILAALTPGCATAHRTGWVMTASVVDARDIVDSGLSKPFTVKVKECVAKHGTKTTGYQTCITATNEYKAMAKWRVYGLPAVNSAVKAAKETLELAEKVQASKGSTTAKVLSALRDGACAILSIVNEWKDLFPAKAKQALMYLDAVKGLACP